MMSRQGGCVQLKQSDMHLALNMAKMAKRGFSRTKIEETEYLLNKPHAQVREEKKRGVKFPGHKMVKGAIEWYLAMLRQNHTPGYLPCPNGTAKNQQICWICNGIGALPHNRHRQQTPEPTPPLPRTPPASNNNTSGAQPLDIIKLSAGPAYSDTSLPCDGSFTIDTSAQDSEHDADFDPDMLPDERTSTG